ncbi:hypothetical protein MLD38_028486 [Melastoma candidum]|uniref:Uncharacterized protein n=1 Tax=Melastoma candidum TaxID=119954 RepID=A0ACB9N2H0_9MYRT|nr:hypothetical protein MLD38_028486 [Melastoma candidum]
MEELNRLERTQGILGLMRDYSVRANPPDPDSDRFLADVILLLVKQRKGLSLERKRALVSEFVPKIPGSLLEEAEHLVAEDCGGEMQGGCCSSGHVAENVGGRNNGRDRGVVSIESIDEAMVGLRAMQRANSTLEDFCRSYFMFHGLDGNKPESVFKFLPVLTFTEAFIYQLDDMNERLVMEGTQPWGNNEEDRVYSGAVINKFNTMPFRPLLHQLELHGLINDRLHKEIKAGEEYWALERKLCFALKSKTEVKVEDVMRAIHLKSFDYRVLNLLLYQIRGAEVDSLHMDFLSVSEFLVEISDDLFDYEDDVLKNSFNILRMFVHVYGASAAPTILAKCVTEAEEKYNTLLKALGPELSASYQRRCEDATREGGNTGGHPLGTWNIPPVIVDEDASLHLSPSLPPVFIGGLIGTFGKAFRVNGLYPLARWCFSGMLLLGFGAEC